NSPGNPTGAVYDESELQALADICVKHDLYIISDEIYNCLVYDGKPYTSMAVLGPQVRERLILVNGVSKAYAMTGWRIGYGLTTKEIAKVMSNYVSQSTGSPCAISQKAALEGLTASQDLVGTMREAFQARRDYMVSRINAIDKVSCIKPEGAFYVMMNIKKLLGTTIGGSRIKSGEDFAKALLTQGKVALIPGEGFCAPGYVRWTYAASMENIKEGMDRLERFLAQ
ncbi:MAG: aminotransferase class I/II-fold pyridoxal phosphate-dependent enzyme, partial [Oscillospiraceae bacterium]|nr:aminotransferase class I/II-fold pyridoxal phosphate-dependent enzyme [Oscillospiraceae bacterium]